MPAEVTSGATEIRACAVSLSYRVSKVVVGWTACEIVLE